MKTRKKPRDFELRSLEVLFTGTEGCDTALPAEFPFEAVRPYQGLLEYKHADGIFNIGTKLGRFLIKLDTFGDNTRKVDGEYCRAVERA